MILLVKSGGEAALPEWREVFAEAAPHLDVRWWDDPTVRPEDVAYVLVWQPEPGRLARYPNLRAICSGAAGVDHITADPDWPRHLPVIRMGGDETAQRMGEYIVFAALALLRDLPRMVRAYATRTWDLFDADRCAPDVTVGMMGLGNLGARSAEMLRGVGFPVVGWSRTAKALPGIETYAGAEGFAPFLARADILCCLLPDTPQTRGIINAETIARLPKGAAVLNAGRGSHVVMSDLVAALDAGRLSAAVLDVFETEPLPPTDPVWRHEKIMVTFHIASLASRRARARFVAEAIATLEAGGRPATLFDPTRGY